MHAKQIFTILVLLLNSQLFQPTPARSQTPVALELVLAMDTSFSVNDMEFNLQMRGVAQAFRSQEVIDVIVSQKGIAVALIQWAGWANPENTIPWTLLTDKSSILAFAGLLETVKRENAGWQTAIGTAIDAALHTMATNSYRGRRLKIDISGDGRSNQGPPVLQSKASACTLGVTINGLAIATSDAGLEDYFRENIITGADAFVITATDYHDFARAIHLKLLKELAPAISQKPKTPPLMRPDIRPAKTPVKAHTQASGDPAGRNRPHKHHRGLLQTHRASMRQAPAKPTAEAASACSKWHPIANGDAAANLIPKALKFDR